MKELRKLLAFVEVARHGSFSAAAEALAVSPAAISKSVTRLEEELGTRLLVRNTRAMQLTSEGRRLFDSSSSAFRDINAALETVRDGQHVPAGIVRLSMVTSFGRNVVMPLLPEFLARYPAIDLRLSLHDGGRALSRQGYDIRINWGEEQETSKVSKLLWRMPLALVTSPEYIALRGAPKLPQDLVDHECIAVALPGVEHPRWQFRRVKTGSRHRGSNADEPYVHIPKGRIVVTGELDTVADAAMAGLGLAVISLENVLRPLREGRLVRLLPDYLIGGHNEMQTQVIIQYAPRQMLAPRVGVLVDYLFEKITGPQ